MTRSRLDCISLTEPSHLLRIDIRILQRFLGLRLAPIGRASAHANGPVGSLNDDIQFSTGLCALLSIRIFLLINGTRFEALLRFADAHRGSLGNAARTNFLVDSCGGLVHNYLAAIFGAGFPKTLIFRKLTLGQAWITIRAIGHARHTIVFVPVGWTQGRAYRNEIFFGARRYILLTTNRRIGCGRRPTNARGHKSRLANILALTRRLPILRIRQKFHAIGTDGQISIIDRICRIFWIETLFGLIVDNLRPQCLVFFATNVPIHIIERNLFLQRLSKHFGRDGFSRAIEKTMILYGSNQIGTCQRFLALHWASTRCIDHAAVQAGCALARR